MIKDLTNRRFGRWLVLHKTDPPPDWKHGRTFWFCRCDCGTERAVFRNSLVTGKSQSCGCLRREIMERQRGPNHPMYRHGHACNGKRTKEWRAWNAMIRRCRYPSMDDYERYGGRGITVCQRWQDSFESFLEDVGPAPSEQHSIDRVDNDGNYESDNVRWATKSEQIKNSRKARLITWQGRTMNLCDWSEETGIKRTTIQMRIDHYGWSVHDALTKPVRRKRDALDT